MANIEAQTSTYSARNAGLQMDNDGQVDIDVRNLLLMLWRRKGVILSCLLIGISLASIAMSLVKSEYTARALVLIETNIPGKQFAELQFSISNLRLDNSFILSEIEVFKSRFLARRVAEKLNLMTDSEFNTRFEYAIDKSEEGRGFKKFTVYDSQSETIPKEILSSDIDVVVNKLLRNLVVRSVPGSKAIQVEYTSIDPNKAALIANTVVDVYIEQRLEMKFDSTKKVTDWLNKRLTDLRGQVLAAEQAVVDYKKKYNLSEGPRKVTISTEQVGALNSQIVQAKTELVEAQARLEQVQSLAQDIDRIETTSEVVNSRLIQGLKQQHAALQSHLSEIVTRYGPKHPEIIKTRAELEEQERKIRSEMLKIAKSLEGEVEFAQKRVASLEEGLKGYEGQKSEDDEAMIGLRELMRQSESTRLIYDTFLQTYKRSDNQEELQESEARVITSAVPPTKPSYPNKMLFLSLSVAISLFMGLALSILIEKLDNTFRSANQLEGQLGYPCYALIPHVENKTQAELTRYIIEKPSSTVAESVRTLRMVLNLRLPKSGIAPKCVTITSSFPGEGKTTLSVWMARLAAKSGEKVIIIDGDLRRPNVHRAFGGSNNASIVDYLTGEKDLDEVIQKDEQTGLHKIYARSVPNSALDLVSGAKMKKLVESLKQVYDLVIIDSPACLAVSDARVLAKLSDQLIYAVCWDQTPREVVISGAKQFSDLKYDDIAFVLTNVDVKRHAKYGYGDTAYYYGRYKEYYAN